MQAIADDLGQDYLGLKDLLREVKVSSPLLCQGKVVLLVGNLVEVEGLEAALGDVCRIVPPGSRAPVYGEVVGFHGKRLRLSPLTPLDGLCPGSLVRRDHRSDSVSVGPACLGRVINGMGTPIDGKGPLPEGKLHPLNGSTSNPLERPVIREQLDVGVRSINGLLPVGKGQRMGIFAGSGVGKSTLLGMMARYTSAPVNVIALIGERGREVNEFLEHELGPEGLEHSVVVVATSDQPATLRLRAAFVACAIAEYFRDRGDDVLLMMDSVTRFAMAAREIGLSAGEPPTTKGYPPSVFSLIPRLLERAGSFEQATITGIFTVLVEGDDLEDPIADTLRSILDGHIVLDRALAQNRHYPAIDVLKSVSRLVGHLLDEEQKALAARFIRTMANYKSIEDMVHIGAYVKGSHHESDYAIDMIDRLNEYLRQPVEESSPVEASRERLQTLFP